jgi:hypothetical protein
MFALLTITVELTNSAIKDPAREKIVKEIVNAPSWYPSE